MIVRGFWLNVIILVGMMAAEHHVVWEGPDGLPGSGKHIVYLTNDHEYRAEETCAALARILAKHYGFRCTFVTGVNPDDGTIAYGDGVITGLEILKTADLMVLGLRFQQWPHEEMQHFVEYLDAGKPVLGLRTSTHAFRIEDATDPYYKYDRKYQGADYPLGFGGQVLGENFAGHYGKNHVQSNLLHVNEPNASHPILRGVDGLAHMISGGYRGEVTEADGVTILMKRTVLDGMTPDSPPSQKKNEIHPAIWVRQYAPAPGAESYPDGRVFTSLHGCSEDLVDENFRRVVINAHLWCLQLDERITADNPIDFVGPYHPSKFGKRGGRIGVKPGDLAGFESPIFDPNKESRSGSR